MTRSIDTEQPWAALRALLDHIDTETCHHEDTHRGGAIWEICNGCGRKWADDEGGFKPYRDPPAVAAARRLVEASASPDAAPGIGAADEPDHDQGVVGELVEALRPFADMADKYSDDQDADDYTPSWSEFVPIGRYRAARAALAKYDTQEGPERIWDDAMRKIGEDHLARAQQPPVSTETKGEGDWIKWAGGKNPVPGRAVEVKIRWRNGEPSDGRCASENFDWSRRRKGHDEGGIIAYRVVTPIEGGGA